MDPNLFGEALVALGVVRIPGDRPAGRRCWSYWAAQEVLTEGKAVRDVARLTGLTPQAIYQAIAKIERAARDMGFCSRCGQKLPEKRS